MKWINILSVEIYLNLFFNNKLANYCANEIPNTT